MALRGDRNYNDQVDISYFSSQATEERGVIMVHATHSAGSGAAMDQGAALVLTPTGADGSGSNPAGLLLNDIVNYDLTRQHINWHKDEVQLGSKVALLRRGVVVTDQIHAAQTPSPGDKAYYDLDGKLSNSSALGDVQVGRFLSGVDADGYAKVEINIV